MDGLFIKCVGKLIINLGKKGKTDTPYDLLYRKTKHNLLNVLETKK